MGINVEKPISDELHMDCSWCERSFYLNVEASVGNEMNYTFGYLEAC